MDRRLGRGAFWGVWLLLFGGQAAVLANTTTDPALPQAIQPVVGGILIAILQLFKLPITVWRLNDIGRPASDALFYVLIPIANLVGLLNVMPEATPSNQVWMRRRSVWSNQIGPIAALSEAIPLTLRSIPVAAPVVLLYGVIMAAGGRWALSWLDWAARVPAETRIMVGQGFGAIALFLLVYLVMQVAKRASATRLSWLPTVFFFPTFLLSVSFTYYEAGIEQQLQLILITAIYSAWMLAWASVGGAGLVVAATLSAHSLKTEGSLDTGAVFAQVPSRALDVAGPHGARVQGVSVGMQLVIPGIFFMLQLAFADTIAVLHRDGAALKDSGVLTWGIRGRLFKLFLLVTAVTVAAHFAIVSLLASPQVAMAYMFDPREVGLLPLAVGEVLWGLSAWVLQVSLYLIYQDRVSYNERRKQARRDRRRAKMAAKAASE